MEIIGGGVIDAWSLHPYTDITPGMPLNFDLVEKVLETDPTRNVWLKWGRASQDGNSDEERAKAVELKAGLDWIVAHPRVEVSNYHGFCNLPWESRGLVNMGFFNQSDFFRYEAFHYLKDWIGAHEGVPLPTPNPDPIPTLPPVSGIRTSAALAAMVNARKWLAWVDYYNRGGQADWN